jgi:membrane fusion protein, multidrug efflux system
MSRATFRARVAQAIVAAAAIAVAACGHEKAPAAVSPAGSPRKVATAEVGRAGAPAELTVPAVVRARQRAVLSARLPASVLALPFREGDRVGAGAVLVRLDDAALRAAVSAAQASVMTAETDRTRTEALLAKGAATPREREEADSRTAIAGAALAGARETLDYTVVRAPFAGVVVARPVHVGDVVSPGAALIEVEGDGGLELEATLEEGMAAAVRPGLAVTAQVDGQPGPVKATIRSLSPAADPATHRFLVKADLPRSPGLRSGLFARLALPVDAGDEPPLTVPASAVFARGGLTGVFVVKEGAARLRWVAVGRTSAGLTEIRAGLDAGERVALDPAGLQDGAPAAE